MSDTEADRRADTVRRPWDDTNDPKPTVWGDDGHVTPEFVEWSMRSARRRMKHLGLDPPDGAWIERFKDEVLDALNEADQSDGGASDG